jgi:hypothetical protein
MVRLLFFLNKIKSIKIFWLSYGNKITIGSLFPFLKNNNLFISFKTLDSSNLLSFGLNRIIVFPKDNK